jgi:hypothetical protein
LELAQGFGTGRPAKAVELLAMDPEDEPETVPSQNGAEDLIEIGKIEEIGYGDAESNSAVSRTGRDALFDKQWSCSMMLFK